MRKNYQNESGRSMVEMLGVLAVMGVLSVGGVAMYTSAMNKHRANELLNEANKRATIVAMQITSGKTGTGLSIAEFTNPPGYTFDIEKKNENQFNITINPVDNDVCTQMKAAVGTNTSIRKINDTCTELTFNNDLSTTVWASDYEDYNSCTNANLKWCYFSQGGGKCISGDCSSLIDSECGFVGGSIVFFTNEGGDCSRGVCRKGTCIKSPYVKGNQGHHTNLIGNDGCPEGYKWATSTDVQDKLDEIRARFPSVTLWLADCRNNDCSTEYVAYCLNPGASEYISEYPRPMGSYPALCVEK